ncbi:hypothetical protein C7R57_05085 [Macrococcoides caseolyticum subsp. caseolyticum]|nr:(4Fe-4S)-binding protein [Macrococcus caseolyticus]RAK47274.1 hypothetical protein C7R57_05085 [Macrococcus caseolyticus subsp. caseolyticus]QQB04936.1 (4Fe-4S)-binding protein [Macrococcus caseolyticus]TDM26568.1 hypothetical protein ETI01_00935 [Macrococcus caseolyticus]TDM30473.1 hypothetical protein ETH98_03355 [Macrococcus caseolyticus]
MIHLKNNICRSYSNDEINVHFEVERSIHATECAIGLKQVFNIKKLI